MLGNPQEIQKLLTKEFPSMRHVKTRSLHRSVSSARHFFIRVPGQENKLDHLSQVVSADVQKGCRVMVFCNTLDSCRAADHFLRDRGFDTCCCHGDVPLDGRKEAIRKFTAQDSSLGPDGQPVMVCTDLAARGLDMPARVDHIVNFDFPHNPVDYIHRAGRTARAGMTGKVTSLLQKRDLVLGERIQEAIRHDRPLDDLSADRRELPSNMRPKPETLRRRDAEKKAERHMRRGRRGAARFEPPQRPGSISARKHSPYKPGPKKPSEGYDTPHQRSGGGGRFASRGSKSEPPARGIPRQGYGAMTPNRRTPRARPQSFKK